ncbi:MAG: cell wall-binding repeat-containing protein [Acidimicrobiales bacterium]
MRKGALLLALAALTATFAAGPASANAQASGVRIAGEDRIATSVAISQAGFPNGASSVVLARADGFADALAGTPLAVAQFAPLLLTPSATLDPRVETEMKRVLKAGATVFLLGLQGALSDAIASQVTSDGYQPTRLGGGDRFSTAVAIANAQNPPKVIVLATGANPADALPGGAAAAKAGGVVLLTDDARMPDATQTYLTQHSSVPVDALGGPAAAADPSATPIVGSDRYETSVLVAQKFFTNPTTLGFANGFAYPDALAGGAAVGEFHGPLLLVAPDVLPDVVHHYTVSVSPSVSLGEVYGGPNVIPDGVLAAIDSAIRGN